MLARRRLVLLPLALGALAACTSSPAPNEGGPTSTPSSAGRPGAVTGLQIQQAKVWPADPSRWGVVLRWTAPNPAPDHYKVIRNDKIIAKDVTTPTYTDATAEPATHYRYRVEGENSAGESGAPANATAKTGAPSLGSARLDGRFYTSLTVTSSTLGLSSGGDSWLFTPHCPAGPCDVTFAHRGTSVTGSLAQSGPSYAGTMSLPFHIRSCFGATVNESITMHLTVYDAAVVHGEWRATRISGTVHEYLAYSGCVSATVDYTVKGTVQT